MAFRLCVAPDEKSNGAFTRQQKTTFGDDIWCKAYVINLLVHLHYSIGPTIHLDIGYIFDALQLLLSSLRKGFRSVEKYEFKSYYLDVFTGNLFLMPY